jgi:hypothetical protein
MSHYNLNEQRSPSGTMFFRDVLRILAPHLWSAALIIGLSCFIPMVALLAYWEKPLVSLPRILSLSNELGNVGDIILIIIPLGSLYFVLSLLFLGKPVFEGVPIRRWIFFTFIIAPFALLVAMQPCLYLFLLTNKHQELPNLDLLAAASCILTTIGCLYTLEVTFSVCVALSQVPIPWQPNRTLETI